MDALLDGDGIGKAALWYGQRTRALIEERSYKLVGLPMRHVDIVRDVLNIVPIHWVATEVVRLAGYASRTRADRSVF